MPISALDYSGYVDLQSLNEIQIIFVICDYPTNLN